MAQRRRTVTYLCVFVLCINDAFGQWLLDDEGCRSPNGEVGNCIPVRQCKPMTDFLTRAPRPLSQEIKTYLNSFTCGYENSVSKVCCPPTVIPIPANRPTGQEQLPPPDVSNHKNLNSLPKDCGYLDNGIRIINGMNANLNEFPWMALLSYNTKRGPQFLCGGTIVNDRWILTAAHCIADLKQPLLGVRVGEYNIPTIVDCEVQLDGSNKCTKPVQDLAIKEIHVHPQYNKAVISNDIGLLKVTKMNLNSENVQPVCLPLGRAKNEKLSTVMVTGWGTTATGKSSDILQKVMLPVVELQECQSTYKKEPRVRVTHKQICAGGRDNKDSCPGDSGGPLQRPANLNGQTRYVQHGIVSFGPTICGLEDYPGVYTRVSYYMDWILDTIHD